MLDYAKLRISTNFHLTDGVHIPLDDESMTAAFSCHVLQHLDSPSMSPVERKIASAAFCVSNTAG